MPVAFSMREYAGGRPSQSSVARRPSPCTPTLLGTEGVLRCCVCCVVDFCLYAAVLRMERCADLFPVFFDIYGDTLCRSAIWFWDSSVLMVVCCANLAPGFFDIYDVMLCWSAIWFLDSGSFDISLMFASVPCSVFFLSVGSVSQRKVASVRAGTPSGDTTRAPWDG